MLKVVTWTDTQIVANVSSGSVTGIARVQQNGAWSNALSFIVTGSGGSAAKLSPGIINMVLGDTRSIVAVNAAGQPVTGLTWTSSNPGVVSVSITDPRVLSALALGHVTITTGGASTDVTVVAGPLPVGTVNWSIPGNVSSIVPAVLSQTCVADVFASMTDGSIQAITGDGTLARTASPGPVCQTLPDFQGGLVLANGATIKKLDGIKGAADPTFTGNLLGAIGVHTDSKSHDCRSRARGCS